MLIAPDNVGVEGESVEVSVGNYLQQSCRSSSTDEADINTRLEEMTPWVGDHMIIPQFGSFRRSTSRSRSPPRYTRAAKPSSGSNPMAMEEDTLQNPEAAATSATYDL